MNKLNVIHCKCYAQSNVGTENTSLNGIHFSTTFYLHYLTNKSTIQCSLLLCFLLLLLKK